ncbi:MAG: lamin tail domain-containing protein [Planctomycetota bacterium]
MRKALLGLIFGAFLAFGGAATAQSVVINEVFTGNPDYVEITNFGAASVDIGGWALHSSFGFSAYPIALIPPGTVLAGGQTLLMLELNSSLPPTLPAPTLDTLVEHSGFSWGWVGNSSGAVVLVDAVGAGRDMIVFGGSSSVVPGNGFGATFTGTIDRTANDPATDNVIQRTTSLDTGAAADWSQGTDADATPGALNATQTAGPIGIRSLRLDDQGGVIQFSGPAGFSLGGTIKSIVTTTGVEIENPLFDPLIGGAVSITGQYTVSDAGTLQGLTLAPATLTLTATGLNPDSLNFINLYQSQTNVLAELGGAQGATPIRYRRVTSLAPVSPQRQGSGSAALDALQSALPASGAGLTFRLESGGARLIEFSTAFEAMPSDWDASFAPAAPGQVEVGVVNAAGTELYHLFVINPSYALGTGPVAGIDFGPLQFEMAISPLGTAPYHVLPAADGTYHFLSPAGLVPPGWTLDFLAVRLVAGVLEVLPPQRATF